MSATPAQRKAAERQRQRDSGLVAVTVWIAPEDRAKLAHYIKRLNERRGAKHNAESSTPKGVTRTPG